MSDSCLHTKTLFFLLLFYTVFSYAKENTCWDGHCHAYNETMNCLEDANCTGVNATLNCADHTFCRGYWSDVKCQDNAVCSNYGEREPVCVGDSYCEFEKIDKPAGGKLAYFLKSATSSYLRTVYECVAGGGDFQALPQGECVFTNTHSNQTQNDLNALFDGNIYTCQLVNGTYTQCHIRDEDGYAEVYWLLMAPLTSAPSNNEIADAIIRVGSYDLHDIYLCSDGSFDDKVSHPGYSCLFDNQNSASIQTDLNNYIGYKAYTCMMDNSQRTLCTVNSKAGLQMLYFKVTNF